MAVRSFVEQVVGGVSFPFQDRSWARKLGIGLLLSLGSFIVPLVPTLFQYGYYYRIMQRVIAGEEPSLPEWDDWGKLLGDGLKLWGAAFIISLPLIILVLIMLGGLMVPWLVIVLDPQSMQYSTLSPEANGLLFGGVALAVAAGLAMVPVSLAVQLLQLPALGHLAARDRFAAALRVDEWWPVLRSAFGAYLIVILASTMLSYVGMMVLHVFNLTIILILVYPFTVAALVFLLMLYLYAFAALAYRDGMRKLALAN